jgi:predicted small secreted protein
VTARSIAAAAVLILALSMSTAACSAHKGPAQRAGERIDKAADEVSDTVDPKGPAQKAGRAIDRATGND